MTATTDIVPDSERRGFIGALPPPLRPYASLMRLDRPIGTWLLYWPCAWSGALAGVVGRWDLFLWLALGAFAARSAGCVYNDVIDRDLDRKVERTRLRPLASGRVSLRAAWILIGSLCALGLVVLLRLDRTAALIALASIIPVAAYPFMKRVTWWPQAWLGRPAASDPRFAGRKAAPWLRGHQGAGRTLQRFLQPKPRHGLPGAYLS